MAQPFSFRRYLSGYARPTASSKLESPVNHLFSQYENKHHALCEEGSNLAQQLQETEKEYKEVLLQVSMIKDETLKAEGSLAESQAVANNIKSELLAKERMIKDLSFRIEKKREELVQWQNEHDKARKVFVLECERIYSKVNALSKKLSARATPPAAIPADVHACNGQ